MNTNNIPELAIININKAKTNIDLPPDKYLTNGMVKAIQSNTNSSSPSNESNECTSKKYSHRHKQYFN